jgi:hypothetical protein
MRRDTKTSRDIRQKAVVVLEPEAYLGYVAWPTLVVTAD